MPLTLNTSTDPTNVDHNVGARSSFSCIVKATVVGTKHILASRGVVHLPAMTLEVIISMKM